MHHNDYHRHNKWKTNVKDDRCRRNKSNLSSFSSQWGQKPSGLLVQGQSPSSKQTFIFQNKTKYSVFESKQDTGGGGGAMDRYKSGNVYLMQTKPKWCQTRNFAA